MTEIKTDEVAGADKNGDSNNLTATELKIIRQIEYYFGDFNLTRDKFLKDAIKADEGWVSMETMLKFQRLSQISNDPKVILAGIKKSTSGLMEVDEEHSKIRRCPEKELPENEEVVKEQAKMTVYVKGFEKEKTSLDDLLDFFSKYPNVINVFKRTWADKKSKERFFKGSVFVTFKDRESAEKFMAEESVKNPEGEELIRKWQEDYNEEKKNEFEDKKRKINEHKAGAKKVKEMVEKSGDNKEPEKEEDNSLPKGAVLKLSKLNDTTTREMLREQLEKDFGVTHSDIAFIYYSKGEPEASLRFKEEDAAKKLLEKIDAFVKGEEAPKKFEINGAEVEYSVLEGEEETTFLNKCVTDMSENRNRSRGGSRGGARGGGHKRRGGFQGRGGGYSKRPRK
jgi:lupus La protein